MAMSEQQPILLSESNMIQVERQIQAIESFQGDANTLYTFISRIDFILALYQTNDARQQLIIFGHIERNISGDVVRALGVTNLTTWTDLRKQLILNYKPQVPTHQLLEDFRNTQFRGNVRLFLEEAERKRQMLTTKLDLENDSEETTLYNRLIKTSIDTLIQKLPTHIYLRIVNCNLPDLRSLINILQEKNLHQKNNSKPTVNSNTNKLQNNNYNKNAYNLPNPITPFQPSYNAIHHQPYYQPPTYMTPQIPRPNFMPQFRTTFFQQQPNAPVPQQPRPFRYTTRQDIFDQNRLRPSFAGAQNNYQPGGNIPANNPIKRARPSDSGQSK